MVHAILKECSVRVRSRQANNTREKGRDPDLTLKR